MRRIFDFKNALIFFTVVSLIISGAVAQVGRLFAGSHLLNDDLTRLDFVILDSETSLPIKGANVRLVSPFDSLRDGRGQATCTDDRGVASR
jgi:hypothetical protein